MNGIQAYEGERARLTQVSDKDSIDEESQLSSSQPPRQNLLHSSVQDQPHSTPLEKYDPLFMSGLYGYCFGLGLAAITTRGDRSDGWTIAAGVIWSSMAGACSYFKLRETPRIEGRIDKSYVAKNVSMISLCAASACIVNWQNFC